MKKVYQMTNTIGDADILSEDSGMALIFEEDYDGEILGDGCLFVRLQSWDNDSVHPLMNSLIGKKIRITVEVEGKGKIMKEKA